VSASSPPPGLPGVHARRVIFIDLARALAAVFMVYGHAIDALLAPSYKTGLWHDAWQFQRGLTSALFLMLSGFAFSVATSRHWASHTGTSPAWWRRVRRFASFVLLGYLLHFPAGRLSEVKYAAEPQWRSFYAVGVFFQKDLFAESWGAMAETLRVRSYRMYCSAKKLTAAPGLTLAEFRVEERRLRRDYADVLARAEASPHADLMEQVLSAAKAKLGSARRQKRTE